MNILIINGPNLNLLGKREPTIYGSESFDDYFKDLCQKYINVNLSYFQSNHEGDLLDKIHDEGFKVDGIVINAGALTHTSLALADAISGVESPFVEVHISNVFKREPVRHHSFLSPVCIGCISGFGLDSYRLAIEALIESNK